MKSHYLCAKSATRIMIQTSYRKKIEELEAERTKFKRYSLCYVWLKVLTFIGISL